MIKIKYSKLICLAVIALCCCATTIESLLCFDCTGHMNACQTPANATALKYNQVTCSGVCVSYLNPNDGLTIYRSCYTTTSYTGSGSFIINNISYNYCSSDLCNTGSAPPPPPPTTSTVTTTTTAPANFNCYSCNQDTAGCGNPINSALLQNYTIKCTGACLVYTIPSLNKLFRGCGNINDTGSSGTGYWPSNGISYNYCKSSLCNTGASPPPTSTTTTTKTTTASKLSFRCYSCYSMDAGCDDPVNTNLIQNKYIQCTGACIVYRIPASNRLFRGCTNDLATLLKQSTNILYNYCTTDLCNVMTAPTAPPTTTASPISTTTIPLTTNTNWMITWSEFSNAVVQSGYPMPTQQQYVSFVSQITTLGGITTKREAAMFLAQILWESDGLQAKREYACMLTQCPGVYGTSKYAGQSYYGRGYIQLSWDYNYGAASQALFGDDRLLSNPDQVATNEDLSWGTAFWYWKNYVATVPAVKNGYFGASTMAINGALECNGAYQDRAQKRYAIYKVVLAQFHVNETPIENGCYN